jgi:hypothetical protein
MSYFSYFTEISVAFNPKIQNQASRLFDEWRPMVRVDAFMEKKQQKYVNRNPLCKEQAKVPLF